MASAGSGVRSPGWRFERADLEVVAVNDIAEATTLAHLLQFDSTYGRLGQKVDVDDHALIVGGRRIEVLSERDPAAIDWGALGCGHRRGATGKFRAREAARCTSRRGTEVLISAPGKNADLTVVIGRQRARLRPACA